jgi:DNA-binding response OmpR family regulator
MLNYLDMTAKNKKILIAEDENAIAKALQLKLEHLGFEVELANNGEEALKALKKTKFDLMLLDIMMPKIDGFGVLAGLKDLDYKPIVLISSNLSQSSDHDKAVSLGADDFLVKSDVSLKEIVEKVNAALGL